MFEKRLKQISELVGGEETNEFIILTHKKHKREIYFLNNNSSIRFIKQKFNSNLKKIVFFLIKNKLLQPFLKKIHISKKLGDVIFVGEQIKTFDLKKNRVYSFPIEMRDTGDFVSKKQFQKGISKIKMAPVIFSINKSAPFSEEELLNTPTNFDLEKIFKKILDYYQKTGIKEVKVKTYLESLMKKNEGKKEKFIQKALTRLKPFSEENVLTTSIHGDFAKEQVLLKEGSYLFTDWNPRKDLIIRDLVSFFDNEEVLTNKKLLENDSFKKLLRMYPEEVKRKLWLYLVLNELSSLLRNEGNLGLSRKRIKEFLSLGEN